jgi:Leucine-rich repeat (LRR) protein
MKFDIRCCISFLYSFTHRSTFLTLKAVNEVYLDNNNLTNISTNTFKPTQRSLKILNLSNNNLSNIIARFHSFHSLVELDLSGNNLDTILESDLLGFSSTTPILKLQLRNSAVRHIDFTHMNQTSSPRFTVQVDLQSNPLLCDCDILEFLRFLIDGSSRSKLEIDTDELQCDKPKNLKNRNVKSLKLTDLVCLESVQCPRRCHCSTKDDVVTVNCDSLNLREIPRMTSSEGQKIVLHLSHDGITNLPVIKQRIGHGNLTEVYLQNNKISTINFNTLEGLKELTVLDLSGNRVTEFAKNVFEGTMLRTLKLTANNFTKVEK